MFSSMQKHVERVQENAEDERGSYFLETRDE